MTTLTVHVEGVGLWSPRATSFAALRAGDHESPATGQPPAARLPASERRRAPPSVRLAVEVAGQALAMSARDGAELACVFGSAHGDQAITDAMCATLARAPLEVSPTRFHHSVHNAAAGYWTIATGCHAPSSAVAAGACTFGAALLEAAAQVRAEARPVLLACSDIAGCGPLQAMTGCTYAFGCALVLAPASTPATLATLRITPTPAAVPVPAVAGNPIAGALPLLEHLAGAGGTCRVMAAPALALDVHVAVRA